MMRGIVAALALLAVPVGAREPTTVPAGTASAAEIRAIVADMARTMRDGRVSCIVRC